MPLQTLIDRCLVRPLARQSAVVDAAGVACLLGSGNYTQFHPRIVPTATSITIENLSSADSQRGLRYHLLALHGLMLGGVGASPIFCDFADHLITRFGVGGYDKLLGFPITKCSGEDDNAGNTVNDRFIGRAMTFELRKAVSTNGLGGGLTIPEDIGRDCGLKIMDLPNIRSYGGSKAKATTEGKMKGGVLWRFEYVSSLAPVSSLSVTPVSPSPPPVSFGAALARCLPRLHGSGFSLVANYEVPWPLGVIIDPAAIERYNGAHASLLTHHLCLGMLREVSMLCCSSNINFARCCPSFPPRLCLSSSNPSLYVHRY
jgi:hypothetical protein